MITEQLNNNQRQTLVQRLVGCFFYKSRKPDCNQSGNDIHWEDTCEFVFPAQGGRVIKVYDGDTITIACKLPYKKSPLYRLSVRLKGIDTPEIKGKTEDEKQAAKLVRDFVHSIAYNKYVELRNVTSEKYGRLLADVYIDNVHLNELLFVLRYAVKYDGGTKYVPQSWLKYRLNGEMN